MSKKYIKLFLRLSLSLGFISACLDRFGLFWQQNKAWGNWRSFVEYTAQLLSWLPANTIPILAIIATVAELIFAICLLIGWQIKLFAYLSGILLLFFALAMTFSGGLKTAFDASVFAASAAAFALGTMDDITFLEIRKTNN